MSVHLEAKDGEIAPTVLLPGDPLRAKWIAETFLEEVFCYNQVRGMLGYTGTYEGKKVSVQGGGMGIPSTLVYCNELIKEYGVKQIIRVGSAGSYQVDVQLNDIVVAMAASTDSNVNASRFPHANYAPTASFELFQKAIRYATEWNIPIKAGNILSSDIFYDDNPDYYKKWADYGVLCVEMETAGIYTLAAKYGIEALTLLTISDSLVTKEQLSHKEREVSFRTMVEMALSLL
ncbi:purine-nucleoside phosphorylase [Flavobacteriaceae bacterium GF1]